MKFFFVTYCLGQAVDPAAAVYRRGLHMALALHESGHEVVFLCPGRENYQNPLTERGQAHLTFVDLPFRDPTREWVETVSELYHHALRQLAPDAIVIGEAPLGGPLLTVALAGAELGIPLLVLDQAPSIAHARHFDEQFGALFDGIVLSGLSWPTAPSHLRCVPLLSNDATVAAASQQAADALIHQATAGRREMSNALAVHGFTPTHLRAALRSQQHGAEIRRNEMRIARLRSDADSALYAVVCAFDTNGARHSQRFWGRRYRSTRQLQMALQLAEQEGRTVYYASVDDALLLEADLGTAELPPLVL